jgi:uncharacterized Zn finger protein (UPF0148 family)
VFGKLLALGEFARHGECLGRGMVFGVVAAAATTNRNWEGFCMIRFACPKCKMALQAHPGQDGASVACPRCKSQTGVRSAAPVAKVAAQPAGPTPDWQRDLRAEDRADQRSPAAAPTSAAPTIGPWYFTRDGKGCGAIPVDDEDEVLRGWLGDVDAALAWKDQMDPANAPPPPMALPVDDGEA